MAQWARRGRRRRRVQWEIVWRDQPSEQPAPTEESEGATMAVAGGACAAYQVRVQERQLQIVRSATTLRSMCIDVEEAMIKLSRGETVTVAGADMTEVRRRVDLAIGRE